MSSKVMDNLKIPKYDHRGYAAATVGVQMLGRR